MVLAERHGEGLHLFRQRRGRVEGRVSAAGIFRHVHGQDFSESIPSAAFEQDRVRRDAARADRLKPPVEFVFTGAGAGLGRIGGQDDEHRPAVLGLAHEAIVEAGRSRLYFLQELRGLGPMTGVAVKPLGALGSAMVVALAVLEKAESPATL